MTKGNGVKTKLDIRDLQNDIRNIKENDLIHLAQDIKRVDDKVESISRENKEAHEKFVDQIDGLTLKLVKIIAIATCIWVIIGVIAIPLIAAYIQSGK